MFACGVSTGELLLWDVRAREVAHELQVGRYCLFCRVHRCVVGRKVKTGMMINVIIFCFTCFVPLFVYLSFYASSSIPLLFRFCHPLAVFIFFHRRLFLYLQY